MRFGTPASETSDTSGEYLRPLKSGDTKVRFLQEIPEWIGYYEHYTNKQAFPCTGDRMTCPGCTHEDESVQKATRRWGAVVLKVDTGEVVPLKLPTTIKKKCESRAARNDGSITSRDFTLVKEGQSLNTEYDVEQEEKYKIDTTQYDLPDIQDILLSMFEDVWGPGSAEEFASGAPKPKDTETRKPRRRETVDDQIERWKEEGKVKSDEGEKGSDEDVVLTEEQLHSMKLSELLALAEKEGIDTSKLEEKAEIIDAIVNAAEKIPY